MRKENKHYGMKLILLAVVGFGVWMFFWDKPAPNTPVEKILSNDVLQN